MSRPRDPEGEDVRASGRLRNKGAIAAAVVVILVFAAAGIEALTFPTAGARTMPLGLSGLIVVLGVGVLVKELRKGAPAPDAGTAKRADRGVQGHDNSYNRGQRETQPATSGVGLPATKVWLVLAALSVLVLVLGTQLGTAIFLVLALRYVYYASWRRVLVTLFIFVLAFGWAWANLLNQPVYEGLARIPPL